MSAGTPPILGPPVEYSQNSDTLPPTYAASQPQILVAPLPDSASFFYDRAVQGEVFVKGLGTDDQSSAVQSLTVQLTLTDTFPNHPTLPIRSFDPQTLYPLATSTSSSSHERFPSISRFNIALPHSDLLPGTLNLTLANRGEVKWGLIVTLTTSSGTVVEHVPVEGTPQDVNEESECARADEIPEEVEAGLEKAGVKCRMLLDTARPRLGQLLRLGVEVRPMERQKTGVAGLSSQPDPSDTLRPLRRVRVEMFRRVRLPVANDSAASSSSATSDSPKHLSLLYASGKSLRYPGSSTTHPPLRVLFTLPTAQLGSVADNTWGEITQSTPYHAVSYFIRTTIGFGGVDSSPHRDGEWTMEREIVLRPKIWKEPKRVEVSHGEGLALGQEDDVDMGDMTEEELKQAYRLKGMDIVGQGGTYRHDGAEEGDLPPPFDGAGPSHSAAPAEGDVNEGRPPTFLESEAQARAGETPLIGHDVTSERSGMIGFEAEDRNTTVGRRGSLGGELGTWIEYDGYETFSVAPPSVTASFGAAGVMDPPQEGDDDVPVGGMIQRLGFEGRSGRRTGRQIMESLGLGEGSRVIDLHDDLPPGIDEPSLPALPGFGGAYTPPAHEHAPDHNNDHDQPPPSFAASEAAVAQRRASLSAQSAHPAHPVVRGGLVTAIRPAPVDMDPHGTEVVEDAEGDAPPGYFGGGQGAGPPAYS